MATFPEIIVARDFYNALVDAVQEFITRHQDDILGDPYHGGGVQYTDEEWRLADESYDKFHNLVDEIYDRAVAQMSPVNAALDDYSHPVWYMDGKNYDNRELGFEERVVDTIKNYVVNCRWMEL